MVGSHPVPTRALIAARIVYTVPMLHESSHLTAQFDGGVLVATVKVEKLGEYEAGVVERELVALMQQPGCRLALDLASVQMIASVGLGLLVSLNRFVKGKKGKMALFNLNDNIRNVLKMTRLDSGLTICPGQAGAIKALA